MQMIASLRRLDYTRAILARPTSKERADPNSGMFEPERAATFFASTGQYDEAIWIIFLATHFGQHGKTGWRLLKDVYSGMGKIIWTLEKVSSDPKSFRTWFENNFTQFRGGFGNHRKYETNRPDANAGGTLGAIESFLNVCGSSPTKWFGDIARQTGNDPSRIFDVAYTELRVLRFGRLAKFDFLALLGRLNLAPLSPGRAYLRGATGPLRGARLLVDGNADSQTSWESLEEILTHLDLKLNVGMQVMEDSICNWQKSPEKFIHFRG